MDHLTSQKTRASRIQKPFTVRFRIGEGKWNIATIKNLSSSGVLLTYNQKIPLNMKLELNISLPFVNESVHCFGRVCRVDEDRQYETGIRKVPIYGIGAYFEALDDSVKKTIDNFAKNFGARG